jgi:PRC-barrel domain
MSSQQGQPERGPIPPPADLEGMEARDASGAPAGRVEDVYVDREVSVTRYVALPCEDPDAYRLVPVEVVRVEAETLVIGVEGAQLSGAPTVPRDAEVTRQHEGDVAAYFADLHDAGYMRPWAEPPQLHGAGYMRPEGEPPEVHGAGYMRPEGEPPEVHGAGYMRPEGEPPQAHGAGYMRPEDEPPEVGGAGRMDPRFLSAVKRWRE